MKGVEGFSGRKGQPGDPGSPGIAGTSGGSAGFYFATLVHLCCILCSNYYYEFYPELEGHEQFWIDY